MKAAISYTGRMRGAVPANKSIREKQKQTKRPASTKGRRKRNTSKSGEKKTELKLLQEKDASARKDPAEQRDLKEKDEAPKKGSRTLRGAARRVKHAIPDIVDKMVEEAKKGNVQHLKTVLQCTGVDKLLEKECRPRKQKSSLAELLIRRLEKQDEPKESDGSRTESE